MHNRLEKWIHCQQISFLTMEKKIIQDFNVHIDEVIVFISSGL